MTAWFLGLNAVTVPLAPAPCAFAQEGDTQPAADDDAVKVPAVELNIDESKYDPPLSDQDKVKEWKRANGETKFKQALRQDPPGAADRDAISSAVKNYLYQMTIKDERDNLHLIVQDVISTLNSPRLTSGSARNYTNEEIVKVARELLGQPGPVRLNALILAASLVSDPTTDPPRPYTEQSVVTLFVDVLDDPNQLVDSKIWAVKGLARICNAPAVEVAKRNLAANHLVDALSAPDALNPSNWLYRLRIVDALGDTGMAYNLQRQPVVIDALVGILSNRKENFMIRSTASRSATRMPWLAADNVNVPLITFQVCQLSREMAEARNANLNAPYWRYCFINVYLSFNPYTSQEREQKVALLQQVTRPHLSSNRALVETAYQAIIPVVNSVTATLNPKPTTAAEIKELDEWLKNHVPDDRKPTPSSKQVEGTPEPRGKPMADNSRSS